MSSAYREIDHQTTQCFNHSSVSGTVQCVQECTCPEYWLKGSDTRDWSGDSVCTQCHSASHRNYCSSLYLEETPNTSAIPMYIFWHLRMLFVNWAHWAVVWCILQLIQCTLTATMCTPDYYQYSICKWMLHNCWLAGIISLDSWLLVHAHYIINYTQRNYTITSTLKTHCYCQ